MRRLHSLTSVVVAVLLISATAAPAAAFAGSGSATADIIQYDGQPSFIVEYDDGTYTSLQDWANAADSRAIVEHNNRTNTATIAAPKAEVSAGILELAFSGNIMGVFGSQLGDKSYVQDIDLNYQLTYAEPIAKLNAASNFTAPTQGAFAFDDPSFPTSGMAFNQDANRTLMDESRDILGANNVSETGASERPVAVIDTGANVANGLVFGNGTSGSDIRISTASKNFLTNETVESEGWDAIQDQNGHGTWTASAIAANTTNDSHDGVAPDSTVLVLKALDKDGSGSTSDIAAAIRYAADQNASVISMSLGSPVYAEALAEAVAYAQDQGSVVVAAVGNSRQTTRWVATPADVQGVIGVGATTGDHPENAKSAYFSQLGPDPSTTDGAALESQGATVDVAAPGMETVARVPSTSGTIESSALSGTSMATPMVAAGVHLARTDHPGWSVSDTREWTTKGATPIPNAAKSEVGHGMFSVENTIGTVAPDTDQADAMTSGAESRDAYYRGMSEASGGFLARVAG